MKFKGNLRHSNANARYSFVYGLKCLPNIDSDGGSNFLTSVSNLEQVLSADLQHFT